MRVVIGAVAAVSLMAPTISTAQDADYQSGNSAFEEVDPNTPEPGTGYDPEWSAESTDTDDTVDTGETGRDFKDFGREMNNPEMQARIGDGLASAIDVLFEMPIGGLLNAAQKMDPNARGRKSRHYDERIKTMGDMAERDNPNLRRDMRRTIEQVPMMMGALVNVLGEMAPTLERAMDKMGKGFEGNRDRDRNPD